jgi:endonuclease/exonuclease/phosphatase family metal-dependent hydrolase
MSISLASFNIHLNGRDPNGNGYYDLKSACNAIHSDIILFQENFYNFTEASNLVYPQSHSQIHQSIGTFELSNKYNYNAFQNTNGEISITLSTKFPILEQRAISVKPYGGDPRDTSLLVKLNSPEGDFWLLGVHLTTGLLPLGSLLQIRSLAKILPSSEPMLIMGDHNLWSPLVSHSLGAEFSQVVKGKTWPAHNPRHQIDQIFSRGFRSLSSKVLPNLGSDHLAIMADVELL